MNYKKTLLAFAAALFIGLSSMNFLDQNDWEVPTKYLRMENPTDVSDSENLAIGKQLYMKHCKSCHGKVGLGDGPKAGELDTPSGDFSSEAFQSQSDGSLFYKTTTGRDDMPAFDKKIASDEDRWLVVNYMRTFSK
jgi:mono/diheme cytochrome c family protein